MDVRRIKRAMDGRGGGPLRAAYRVATAAALVGVRGVDRLAAGRPDPGERAESARTVTMAVKTFKRRDGKVWLMPHNPEFSPIDGDHATILGKVTAVLRRV